RLPDVMRGEDVAYRRGRRGRPPSARGRDLRRNRHVRPSPCDEALAVPVTVSQRRVDEGDPGVNRRPESDDRVVVLDAAPHRLSQSPRAESDLGDRNPRPSERTRLHTRSPAPARCAARKSATPPPTVSSTSTAP